jgi:hypothetical protein
MAPSDYYGWASLVDDHFVCFVVGQSAIDESFRSERGISNKKSSEAAHCGERQVMHPPWGRGNYLFVVSREASKNEAVAVASEPREHTVRL